jgi:hypothetical protein
MEKEGMAAVLAVDPEGALPRQQRALGDVPYREMLVPQIEMEEVAPAGNDRPERRGGEEREEEAREQPARTGRRKTGDGRRRAQRFVSSLPSPLSRLFTA